MFTLTRRAAGAFLLSGIVASTACSGAPTQPPAATPHPAPPAVPSPVTGPTLDALDALRTPALGDLDAMIARGVVRVIAPASRTLYWIGGDGQHGGLVEAGRALQQALRAALGPRGAGLTVAYVPVAPGDALRALTEGRGDIALTLLPPVPEAVAGVTFSASAFSDVREVVVTGPGVPKLVSLEDLAGRELLVVSGSRHHDTLLRLNARLAEIGKPGCTITPLGAPLDDEDLLEMVNAGLVPATLIDSYIAASWRPVLPQIAINEDVAVSQDATLVWAVRANAPDWLAQVNTWAPSSGVWLSHPRSQGPVGGSALRSGADASVAALVAATAALDRASREAHVPASWVAAWAFERQRVAPLELLEDAHALATAMARDVPGARVDARNKVLLALAGVVTDASRVAQARAETVRLGLDGDRWLGHVEVGAARVLGREVVDQVRRVAQYESAFRWRLAAARRPATSAARHE